MSRDIDPGRVDVGSRPFQGTGPDVSYWPALREAARLDTHVDVAVSQARVVVGHRFMTNIPDGPDLSAIAREAQVEIVTVEAVQAAAATPDDAAGDLAAAELGYYEAELRSLRDAARRLAGDVEENP